MSVIALISNTSRLVQHLWTAQLKCTRRSVIKPLWSTTLDEQPNNWYDTIKKQIKSSSQTVTYDNVIKNGNMAITVNFLTQNQYYKIVHLCCFYNEPNQSCCIVKCQRYYYDGVNMIQPYFSGSTVTECVCNNIDLSNGYFMLHWCDTSGHLLIYSVVWLCKEKVCGMKWFVHYLLLSYFSFKTQI